MALPEIVQNGSPTGRLERYIELGRHVGHRLDDVTRVLLQREVASIRTFCQ
jgi:hypothetical protein